MYKKILIPIKIQTGIEYIINSDYDFVNLKEKQKIKLKRTLITLWYFIYNKQRNDKSTINLSGYTNISRVEFGTFSFQYNKNRLKHQTLLNLLVDNSIIDINSKFSSGNFSKGYRINSSFISTELTEVELDFDKIFHNIHNREHWLNKYPKYIKNINESYDIKIDLSSYITWLNNNKGIELKPVIIKGRLSKRILNDEKIYNYIQDALKINFQNLWFKVSDEGRFYNSLTNLSYTSLPFLSLKGRAIREIDITNCQPLLLSLLVDNTDYKKDVENGIFYENMAKELGISRNEFKVLSYKYIFFSNKQLRTGIIYNALETLYPGLIEQINVLRNDINISRELQKVESSIMVDKIGQLDYNMMLRHDAAFVYEEDYNIICDILEKEFKKIGLKVTIKNKDK